MLIENLHISAKSVLITLFCALLAATPAAAADISDMGEDELKQFIQNYLLENPEVIISSLEKFQEEQEAIAARYQSHALEGFIAQASASDTFPTTGPDDGDVTMIEFFDYQCGYCKRAFPDMMDMVENDGNIKVIFVELPILGPASKLASLAAMAAKNQGKYVEYHTSLMETRGKLTQDKIFELADDLDMDLAQLRADMESDDVKRLLNENLRAAETLGVNGTPAFIIGNELFKGAIPREQMEAAAAAFRNTSS